MLAAEQSRKGPGNPTEEVNRTNVEDSPIATTALIVISLANCVSVQGGRDRSRRMTAAQGETERDKVFKTESSVILEEKNPHRGKIKGLCFNSCSRDLTSFFDSQQDMCRAQMDSNQLSSAGVRSVASDSVRDCDFSQV